MVIKYLHSKQFETRLKKDQSCDGDEARQMKRSSSHSCLEKLEDLVMDGVCVAGSLDICEEATEMKADPIIR